MHTRRTLLAGVMCLAGCSVGPAGVGPAPTFVHVAEVPSSSAESAYFGLGLLGQHDQPEALLAALHAAGVHPDAAWFSPYQTSSCPGAEAALTVIVPGALVVRVPAGTARGHSGDWATARCQAR